MILQAENIKMNFEDLKVLQGVDLELRPGQITALIGRNGSGKTTLIEILSRVLNQREGAVYIDGIDIKKHVELQENIVYLPDRFDFFKFETLEKAMIYYKIVYPNFDSNFVREECERHGLPMKKQLRTFSKGNLTLTGLILVLATKAPFVLLDEVLDGMDVLNKKEIIKYLIDAAGDGQSILISSHQIHELQGISNVAYYLTLEGELSKIDDADKRLIKVQVVTRGKFPEDLKEDMVLINSIGRVHTLLMEEEEGHWQDKLNRKEIVQYDNLGLQLEDLFYWEQAGKEMDHERH